MEDRFLRGFVAAVMELKKDNNANCQFYRLWLYSLLESFLKQGNVSQWVSYGLINTFYLKPKYGVLLLKIVSVLPFMHLYSA